MLKDVGHDKVLDELIENFEIDINDVKKVYNTMKPGFKAGFNAIFTRIKLFFEKGDKSLKPIDKFNKSVEGLGKVAKNEVITPDEIVDKMIAKLDDDEYLNAESILLVNEKKGEFLQGLIRKFKPEIAKKCKIIPSSMIGKQLTSKMLKTQNLNDYINDIIIDLEDYDKSGKIDVKDFLKMTNEEVLKKNDGRRFDVCLMNPPYNAPGDSKSGEGSIESEFINKLNKICNYVIAVYPFSRWQKREKISKENSTGGHLEEIDIYDIHNYFDVATQWKHLGIWKYNNVKEFENTQIHDFIKDKEYNVETKDNLDNIKKVYSEITNELISVKPIIEKYKKLYDDLVSKYKTMVNDGHGFIYEENRFKGASRFGINRKNKIQRDLERVRKYLKEGRYKYCLYHGSYNGPLFKEWKGEDPDKLFKGQLCWLTNSKTVQNNILYWTQSVLFNLWSAYYIGSRGCNDGMFGYVPALDFEMNENDFKEYVDSLNDFTDEEIKILKDNKIYNADKL